MDRGKYLEEDTTSPGLLLLRGGTGFGLDDDTLNSSIKNLFKALLGQGATLHESNSINLSSKLVALMGKKKKNKKKKKEGFFFFEKGKENDKKRGKKKDEKRSRKITKKKMC